MLNRLVQPGGVTSTSIFKEVFSTLGSIDKEKICVLESGLDLTGYEFGLDAETKQLFHIGAINSIIKTVSNENGILTIVTDLMNYQLPYLPSSLVTVSIKTFDDLLRFEPWYDGQKILLEKVFDGGPVVNHVLYHKASNTIADNVVNFSTEKGKIWTFPAESGYDIYLAGYRSSDKNFSDVFNKIVAYIVKKVLEKNSIKGVQRTITIEDDSEIFELTNTLIVPTFVTVRGNGSLNLNVSTDLPGIEVRNDIYTDITWSVITSGFPNGNGDSGFKIFDFPGRVLLFGPGKDISTQVGLLVGNLTSDSNAPVRDITLSGIYISGFKDAISYGMYNTYNTYIDNVHTEMNINGLVVRDGSVMKNSGESHNISNSTFSQNTSSHVTIGSLNISFNFTSCHFDYSTIVFQFNANAWWTDIKVTNSWIEGFESLVTSKGTGYTGAPVLIIDNSIIDARPYLESTWGGPRQIIHSAAGGKTKTLFLKIKDTKISFPKNPAYPSTLLAGFGFGYGDSGYTSSNIGGEMSYISYKGDLGYYHYPFLLSARNSLHGSAEIVGTPGLVVDNSYRGLFFKKSAGVTVTIGESEADYSGQKPLIIQATETTDYIHIVSLTRVKLDFNDIVASTISVKVGNAEGKVLVGTGIFNYAPDVINSVINATDNTVTNKPTRNLLATIIPTEKESTNILSYLNDTGTPATKDDYLGSLPTLNVMSNPWSYGKYNTEDQYEYSNISVYITGFTGTINVMLPYWWRCN